MRPVTSRLARLALLCALMTACETPNATLHVDVQTDLVPELELAVLEIEVFGGSSAEPILVTRGSLSPSRLDAEEFLSTGARVASFDALAPGTYTVRVVGRESAEIAGFPADSGPILVETRVLVSLRAGTPRVVRAVLGARCAEHTCPDGDEPELTACLNGRCVRPTCDLSDGEVCDDPAPCAMGDPDGCSPSPACATVICSAGACLNVPVEVGQPGACPEGEYCGRDGCAPLPGPTAPDAGPADAYVEPPDAFLPIPDASGPCGPIGTPCDDGNACTGGDACNATGCAGRPLTGTACGTRDTCRGDRCEAGACMRVNLTGACASDGRSCTQDLCSGGACTHPAMRNGTACSDGDGNACTTGECSSGSCTRTRLADGTGCGSGRRCCSGSCVNTQTDANHCGVCGVDCGSRRCESGLCECSTNTQCTPELGSLATCWDSTFAEPPTSGMHCQCQCPAGSSTCDACPGTARCRMESGYNHCYYP